MTSNSIYALFKSNKYTLTYFRIIENRKKNPFPKNVYVEKHHIIPKCMGGDNNKANLIKVSGREHFVLHQLLTKMADGQHKYKMLEAFSIFSNNKNRNLRFTSRQIESMRKANAIASSERNKGNSSWLSRSPDSDETRQLKSQSSAKSRWINNGTEESFTQSHIEMVELNLWSYGRIKSDKKPGVAETTITKSRKDQEKIKCEFCGGIFSKGNYKASHGENCKHNPNRSQISIEREIAARNRHKEWTSNNPVTIHTCPHCNFQSDSLSNMKRWHFDNCKIKDKNI